MDENRSLVAWLNDAHAMEQSMLQVLEGHAILASEFPEFRARLEEHRAETLRHRDQIAQCLRSLGHAPSAVKTTMATVTGLAQGVTAALARDAILKNALADYAAESLEIATYTALVAAAAQCGLQEIVGPCRAILEEEVEMAGWLEECIPELAVRSLTAAAAG